MTLEGSEGPLPADLPAPGPSLDAEPVTADRLRIGES